MCRVGNLAIKNSAKVGGGVADMRISPHGCFPDCFAAGCSHA